MNSWITDSFVDGELAYVMQQRLELSPKVAAIKEYNAVRGRVKNKIEVDFTKEAREALANYQPFSREISFLYCLLYSVLPDVCLRRSDPRSDRR